VASYRSHAPKPAPLTANAMIIAVGWRVFVNRLESSGGAEDVVATNGQGMRVTSDLRDGQEVEVTAWQPHSRDGVLYRVKRLNDGAECWLPSAYLRRSRARAVAAAT
jgi:hypothetical protein